MLGALLGAGASLIGGFLGREGAREANAANLAMAERNIALQREFATHGVRWKVADAQKAGVHPLYALGASTTSFSPVSVGAVNEAAPMANAMHAMGQNVSRAAAAYEGPSARVAAVDGVLRAQSVQSNALQLENMSLQNQILRSRLATLNQPGTPPGVEFPVPENKKVEERPPLMLLGKRWLTNPNTSPMKAYEDQYGDEGPVAWTMPLVIGANDALYNASQRLRQTSVARYMLEAQRAIQERYVSRRPASFSERFGY